eukprot:UN32119
MKNIIYADVDRDSSPDFMDIRKMKLNDLQQNEDSGSQSDLELKVKYKDITNSDEERFLSTNDGFSSLEDIMFYKSKSRSEYMLKKKEVFVYNHCVPSDEKSVVMVPLKNVIICCICKSKFTFSLRKHHCRGCGRIVCINCCQNTEIRSDRLERACLMCRCHLKVKRGGLEPKFFFSCINSGLLSLFKIRKRYKEYEN